ncbi:MAG: DUF4349 domain-containing protein [Polyangiaceae bacterium]
MHASRWGSVCLWVALGLVAAPAIAGTGAGTGAGRQQEAFADESIQQMKQTAATVRSKLGAVRYVAGPTRECLDGALTRLEVVEREAQDARADLRRASLREDLDGIAQAGATMSTLDARAKALRAEADACSRALDQPIMAAMRDERPARRVQLESLTKTSELSMMAGIRSPPSGMKARVVLADVAPAPTTSPAAATPGPAAAPPAASPYAHDAAHDASMLAYSADLTLAVFQVDRSLGSVESLARDLGGYLAQRGDTSVTVRVPRPRFDEALGRIEKLGDVLHRNVAAEDVTDEYVDLELRLKNARAMRDQLAGLLHGAAVKDAVEIEKELAKVTEVIEQIEGRLKVMRDKVGYSSITVSFQATAPSTVRSTSILPFAWLDTMGLESLLDVPKGTP